MCSVLYNDGTVSRHLFLYGRDTDIFFGAELLYKRLCPSVCLTVCLSFCLPVFLSTTIYLHCVLPSLSDNFQAHIRNFLGIFQGWIFFTKISWKNIFYNMQLKMILIVRMNKMMIIEIIGWWWVTWWWRFIFIFIWFFSSFFLLYLNLWMLSFDLRFMNDDRSFLILFFFVLLLDVSHFIQFLLINDFPVAR